MAPHQIEKLITDLFKSRYPNCEYKFQHYNGMIQFSSTFGDRDFLIFSVKQNSFCEIKTINRYLPETKKLFSINKMKRTDFRIVDEFFNTIIENHNFNKMFKIKNSIKPNDWVNFVKGSKFFVLPFTPSINPAHVPFFIDKLHNTHYRCSHENHFKMNKNGEILIVPMISVFGWQRREQVFAFNIYEQKICRVKKEEFFFEDLFENNEEFNSEYHGDVLVDEYIDYLLLELSEQDEIRQELILYPRNQLSDKVDLLSMYRI